MSEEQQALRNPLTGKILAIGALLTATLAIYQIFNLGAANTFMACWR